MRLAGMLLVTLSPICLPYAVAQELPCSPCIDGPEMLRRAEPVFRDDDRPPASQIAATIRETGGELSDIAHDCASPRATVFRQVSFSVTACSWGGRYPALLIGASDGARPGSVVVIAASGSAVEVLFDVAAPMPFVEAFSGLLKADFDELYREASQTDDERTPGEAQRN